MSEARAKLAQSKSPAMPLLAHIVAIPSLGRNAKLSPSRPHQEHIAPKCFSSEECYSCVHTTVLIPKAMQIPDAKAALEKEWTKLEMRKAWDVTRVWPKADVLAEEALRNKRPVHVGSFMDLCHIKNSGPIRAEPFFALILSKIKLNNSLSLLSREPLLQAWPQQNSWMLLHACLATVAKILMPWVPTHR